MKRKNLFDITREYHDTLNELEAYFEDNPDEAGVVPDEFMERLNINKDELDEKLEAYFYTIKELELEMSLLKEEAARLVLKSKSKQITIDNLKKIMTQAVVQHGEVTKTGNRKYIHPKFNISVQYSKPIVVENEEAISSEFKQFEFASKRLDAATLKELKEYLEDNPTLYTKIATKLSITGKVDKKLLKSTLNEGEEIEGVYIDNESSFIKFT